MTTFHTHPCTNLPAPHDCELAPPFPRLRHYGFNGATKLLNINEDREFFHRWCGRFVNMSLAYRKETWEAWYAIFRNQQAEDELKHPSSQFEPFMAVTFEGQLVAIYRQTPRGHYVDTHGDKYQSFDLTRDLRDYAEREAEDARDLDDTQQDARW